MSVRPEGGPGRGLGTEIRTKGAEHRPGRCPGHTGALVQVSIS